MEQEVRMKCLQCEGSGIINDGDAVNERCVRCNSTGEVDFYTEQSLKQRCTPKIIKKMCELAEGFEKCGINYPLGDSFVVVFNKSKYNYINLNDFFNDIQLFSTLIHRAVEGLNNLDLKKSSTVHHSIQNLPHFISRFDLNGWVKDYRFKNYQRENLTALECACLHCLIEILEEEGK
jgi:hypothetical protein